jgi:hypothetical protein
VQASLPMIVEPTDWTTVVNFPAVYTDKVTLRIESVFPPALPDTYATNGNGQVAISGIQFLQKWDLTSLFNFSFREQAPLVPPGLHRVVPPGLHRVVPPGLHRGSRLRPALRARSPDLARRAFANGLRALPR